MMRKLKNIGMMLFLTCAMLSVTSCDEDDWYYDGWWEDTSWENDRRIEDALSGVWYLSYVEIGYGDCPYRRSDEFYFGPDGRFEVRGAQGFNERGKWYVEYGHVIIDFYNERDEDMEGKIEDLNRHFVALDIKDYDYKARYYLEMKR